MTALPLSLLDLDDEDYVGGFQRSSKPTLLTSIDNLPGYTVLFIHEYTELVIMCACMIYSPPNDSAASDISCMVVMHDEHDGM
jgi:hypothetical protein